GGIVAALMHARGDSLLHGGADRPVLPVHEIPESGRIGVIEVRLPDLVILEEEMTRDIGARRTARPQYEYCRVVACKAQKQVGISELALVAHLLVLVERGKCAPLRRAARCERIRARPVRDAAQPIEVRAPAVTEGRYDGTQLGVHATAVIALVVVLADDFPVRRHRVLDRVPDPKLRERIALHTLGDTGDLLRQRFRGGGSHVEKHESAPGLDADRIETERALVETGFAGEIRR